MWSNALLLILALISTVATVILASAAAVGSTGSSSYSGVRPDDATMGFIIVPSMLAFIPGALVLVFFPLAGRRRGLTTGISTMSFSIASFIVLLDPVTLRIPELTLLTVGRLLTLATTVAALLPAGQGVAVPWPTFQRRCKRAFILSGGFIIVLATSWSAIGTTITPLDFNDTPLGPLTLAGLTIAGTTALAAAYFAGVRYVPLLVGGTVVTYGIAGVLANETEPAIMFSLLGLLVLGAFYWQIQRTAERPPRESWETRWHKWRWPLAILPVAASATLGSLNGFVYFLWIPAIFVFAPGIILLLHAMAELTPSRFTDAVTRFRDKSPLVLHFD